MEAVVEVIWTWMISLRNSLGVGEEEVVEAVDSTLILDKEAKVVADNKDNSLKR